MNNPLTIKSPMRSEKHLKIYSSIYNERQKENKEFIKHIVTISIGFLALFVGLRTNDVANYYAKCFYLITIILLVFGIIFSSLTLYKEIYFGDKKLKSLKEEIRKIKEGGAVKDILLYNEEPIYYKWFEIIGFVSFLLSPISLILYIFFLELF